MAAVESTRRSERLDTVPHLGRTACGITLSLVASILIGHLLVAAVGVGQGVAVVLESVT